jgi:hypothetical protein
MAATYLRQSEYQFVRKNILEGRLDNLVARKIIPADPSIGPGAQEAKRWNYVNPDDEAEHIPKGGDYPYFTTSMTPTTVPIHKFGLGIEYDEWDLESSRTMGQYSLDKKLPRDLGRKMAEYEDKYILNGDASVGVSGLTDLAGNTHPCPTKWDATSGADPYDDFNTATGKVEAYDFKVKSHPSSLSKFIPLDFCNILLPFACFSFKACVSVATIKGRLYSLCKS